MQIKKFLADTHLTAMQLIKKEWGDDALILNTRSIRIEKPLRHGEKKFQVEITAAIDFSGRSQGNWPAVEPVIPGSGKTFAMQDETDLGFKVMDYTSLNQTDKARPMRLKGYQLTLYRQLVDSGVNEKLAAKIFEKTNVEGMLGQSGEVSVYKKRLASLVKRALVCKGPIEPEKNRTKVVAFVGPTGVGKTTTIAKLAANYVIKKRKSVALITLDTWRVGAVDQLKVYGKIMRVPVETASSQDNFRKLLNKHRDKDYIFVDTAGRSHKDHSYAGHLNEVLKQSGPVETHLVLSVTLQEKIFSESFRQFSLLKPCRVLFTKLDEGVSYGPMLNFSLRTKLPFSYFTTGQRVPEDIEVADKEKVIRLIFN